MSGFRKFLIRGGHSWSHLRPVLNAAISTLIIAAVVYWLVRAPAASGYLASA